MKRQWKSIKPLENDWNNKTALLRSSEANNKDEAQYQESGNLKPLRNITNGYMKNKTGGKSVEQLNLIKMLTEENPCKVLPTKLNMAI